jgi:hypothetical protein
MNFFCVLLSLLWFKIIKNNFVVYQPNGNKKKFLILIIFGGNAEFGLNCSLFIDFLIKYGYQTRLSLQTAYCKL